MFAVDKLYYANQDLFICERNEGPVLQFRNGKRDITKVQRALELCNMRIKKKFENYYLLEVANA